MNRGTLRPNLSEAAPNTPEPGGKQHINKLSTYMPLTKAVSNMFICCRRLTQLQHDSWDVVPVGHYT